MKVKELIEILDNFKKDTEIKLELWPNIFLYIEKEDIQIFIPTDEDDNGQLKEQFIGIKTNLT